MIYNVDEKGLSTTHKLPKTAVATGSKPPSVTSSIRTSVTILGFGNALDYQLHYFEFFGERIRSKLLDGKTAWADWMAAVSGRSNAEVFTQYLHNHLIKYLPKHSTTEPVLLLYDGHKLHVRLDLTDWPKSVNIILFVLPPLTNNILQTTGRWVFLCPFEYVYNRGVHKFMCDNCVISVSGNNLWPIACNSYITALYPLNLQASFKNSGFFPFNPDVIDTGQFLLTSVFKQEEENCSPINTEPETKATDIFVTKENIIQKKNQEHRNGNT